MTLIDKLRGILSAQGDDYYSDEELLNYINKAEQFVVNLFIDREKSGKVSAGVLDKLRKQRPYTVSGDSLTYTALNDYYTTQLTVPSDMLEPIILDVNFNTILRQLNYNGLYLLKYGNAVPSVYEGYYNLTTSGSTNVIKIFHYDNLASNVFNVYYIKKLTPNVDTTETVRNIGEQLENAVLYYAAYMAVTQENIREPLASNNAKEFLQIYTNELSSIRY
jgi:hypothetical protein